MLFDHFASSAVMVEAPKISKKHCLLHVSLSMCAGGKLVVHYIEFPGFHGRLEGQEKFLEHLHECLVTEAPSQPCVTITVALTVSPWTYMSHMLTQILSEALFSS